MRQVKKKTSNKAKIKQMQNSRSLVLKLKETNIKIQNKKDNITAKTFKNISLYGYKYLKDLI
jgi:hypothetical protein